MVDIVYDMWLLLWLILISNYTGSGSYVSHLPQNTLQCIVGRKANRVRPHTGNVLANKKAFFKWSIGRRAGDQVIQRTWTTQSLDWLSFIRSICVTCSQYSSNAYTLRWSLCQKKISAERYFILFYLFIFSSAYEMLCLQLILLGFYLFF